jgi:glutamate synthase domain-containing protein 2
VRFTTFALCVAGLLASLAGGFALHSPWLFILALALAGLSLLGLRDVRQTRHAILRNYPVIGHLRFLLEYIRPEVRQYFIESDTEAAPFSRAQRSLVYQRAKGEPDNRPFGTQLDVGQNGYEWINHSLAPTVLRSADFRITIGAGRAQPYEASVFNISAMSFGSLSAAAILALNRGAKLGRFAHDTGEGSISEHHRVHGGDLIWEIGSGYFGCRDAQGRFDEERFVANAREPQVKMIEIKLSQGAKPGHGGILPGAKVTPEISRARGVPAGMDCISPSSHSAFSTPTELLAFVDRLRTLSGASPPASSCASATPGNGSASPRRCWPPGSRRISSWSMAPKAAPVRHRWNSATTSARRCRKGCCWCTTRWWARDCGTASGSAAPAR